MGVSVMYYVFAFLLGCVVGALVNKKRTVDAVEEAISNLLDIEPGDDDGDPDEEEIWEDE